MSAPLGLRVEHLENPLGINVRKPRLSWRLPLGSRRQTAYQIRTDRWDSGKVVSDQPLLVPYEGPELTSGERVDWSVRTWTDAGTSEWAAPAWWEMGLLSTDDWMARFIEPVEDQETKAASPRPAYLFRRSFTLDQKVARARLYVTAHGVYECFINGTRVGDMELTPGFTSYWSNLQVQTFDVTDMLRPGENVLGAIVSDGWFRGQDSGYRLTNLYGDSVALLAQLHVHGTDDSHVRIGTDPEWSSSTGAIREADLFQGQTTDLSKKPRDWCTPGSQSSGWQPVMVRGHDLSRLTSSPMPPVRRVEELRPVAVTRPHPDRQVVDLGQNINGWIRLDNLGPAGTKLSLTYGEALDADGDVTLENLVTPELDSDPRLQDLEFAKLRLPFQVDHVTSAGHTVDRFEPRHTVHGFQYVRIEGHHDTLTPDDVSGVAVHTDMRRTGEFECSDKRINALHEAAVWSFRGNACDIPTDCPTRERAGWTGDWQIFVSTAAFVYDVAGFSTKWLRDLASEQQDDGLVFHCAPETMSHDVMKKIGAPHGSAGWGDAAVIVPWEIYRAYGDRDLLDQQWSSMVSWVEYAARAAREGRHPDRAQQRPAPAAHEEFIWDTGYHWGEWLEPDEWSPDLISRLATEDHGIVATAYLHYSARLLATVAQILSKPDDANLYTNLAAATRAAWQAEFINADGTLARDTQATYVRALSFDLVPDELRPQAAQRLVELIRKADTHLATGFLSTPYLLPVLADAGYLDVAYELLFQDTEPSWLSMIDRGGTTIWEDWHGIDEQGRPYLSLNHYSKGAVISFLHRYVAGIQLLDDGPAYRPFRIAPMPGGGITHARADHDSPYGRITSNWHTNDDKFELDVTIPPGTTAEIHLPNGQRIDAEPGVSRHTCTLE
ncbi:glycoside hydrolase family 78 protein [Phytoactinopolyspora endophytica]|uniref:glycoside hydrolase family 78 protein n=1 Tax=Phytoactinopolyspora endophytica TaxID=1642495 RepID=UPI00101C22C2|nr:glycoside hydrolase family 78 protein [Phytoactinopolyspora endophytica]